MESKMTNFFVIGTAVNQIDFVQTICGYVSDFWDAEKKILGVYDPYDKQSITGYCFSSDKVLNVVTVRRFRVIDGKVVWSDSQ